MRNLFLIMLLCLPALLFSQHNHFVYIQGENQQLFYVKKAGEVISSSSTGYIILSKMQPGTHQFTIGFPRDQFPEYEFQVEVSGKDRGFTLKNFQEKGWGLFDLQSMEVIMGKRVEVKKEKEPVYGALSDDPFAMILASAVNDPGIRETSLVHTAVMVSAPTVPPADKAVAVKNKKPDAKTAVADAKTETTPEVKPAPVTTDVAVAEAKKPEEEKAKEVAKTETQVAAVVPKSVEQKPAPALEDDKAKVAKLPAEKKEPAPVVGAEVVQKAETGKPAEKYTAQRVQKISELKTWTGYQLTYVDNSGAKPDTITVVIDDISGPAGGEAVNAAAATEPLPKAPRTDCKTMAREKDVLNLRKKMLSMSSEEDMTEAALRELRQRCYTVEQLQNISYVFVTDAGRFRLFEQSYPFIFDPANFHRLEKLFNGEEYQGKFRSLIQ